MAEQNYSIGTIYQDAMRLNHEYPRNSFILQNAIYLICIIYSWNSPTENMYLINK